MNHIGVSFEDSIDFYPPDQQEDWTTSSGQRQLSVITQNVDHLHSRAGAQHVTELHGRTSRLRCMHCGYYQSRNYFHGQLEGMNEEWLRQVSSEKQSDDLRPDGDGNVHRDDYSDVCIPACPHCGGFFKPDVVFFGDSVPKHRVARCRAAVEASDGLLCIGTSLAVHSAFRFVKAAANSGVPIAILNVGETRAEAEGLDCLKIEAPIGSVLTHVVKHYEDNTHCGVHCNIRYS
jgi:NAD+-dependent protein deacetylase sirtuin 4